MNRIATRILSILALCMAVCCLTGCGQNNTKSETTSGYKSKTYQLVKTHIDSMSQKPWDKKRYLAIKNDQLPLLKKKSERTSASDYLEGTYSQVTLREAKRVLEGGCRMAKDHDLLATLMKELEAYPMVPGLKNLKEMEESHRDAIYFVRTAVGRQPVKDHRTSYDEQYEKEQMAKAQRFLDNSKLKCMETRKRLESLTKASGYINRRRAYCKAIVDAYLQCDDAQEKELNAAKSRLKCYNGGEIDEWKRQMDEHFQKLNQTQEQ